MDRFLNKMVVLTLKTGTGIKGTVVKSDENEIIVQSTDSLNYTVIFNPSENIMMVSVYVDIEEDMKQPDDIEVSDEIDDREIVEPELQLDHFEPDPEMRALKLADLHLKKKEALTDLLNNHFKNRVARMPQAPSYDSPDFTK